MLDKSITILFGENGSGKSSFFDAIEWCITGEIERFKPQDGELSFSNFDCVNRFARQKEDATCSVTIYYDQYKLRRTYYVKTNYTYVSLHKLQGKEEILVAQGQQNVEVELRKYKEDQAQGGSKLIKHSYILSQDQITDFIRSNPKDRFDSLASIMGISKVTKFIDNLKTSHSVLTNFCNEIKSELVNNQKLINDRVNDRNDYYELKKSIEEALNSLRNSRILTELEINKLDQLTLDNYRRKTANKLAAEKQKLALLEKIPSSYKNYNDINDQLLGFEKELESAFSLLTRSNDSANNTKGQLEALKLSFKKIDEQKELLHEIAKIKSEIEKIHLELTEYEYAELSIKDITQKLNERRDKLQIFEYALLNCAEFNKAKKDLSEIPRKIKDNELQSNLIQRKMERTRNTIFALKKWIKSNNVSSSLKGLVQYLQGIYEYVKENDVGGVCPACSTHVGDALGSKIKHNITYHEAKITKNDINVMKVFDLQATKEGQLSALEREHSNLKQERTKLQNQLKYAQEVVERFSQNELFDFTLFQSEETTLVKEKKRLSEEIAMLMKIREKKLNVSTLERKYEKLLESINAIGIEGNLIDSLKKRERLLDRKSYRLAQLIKKTEQKIERIKEKRDIILPLATQLANYTDLLKKEKSFEKIAEEVRQVIIELENAYQILDYLKELMVKKEEKKEGLASLIRYEEQNKNLNQKLQILSTKRDKLDEYIKILTSKVGEHAIEILNHPHSKIQQYYRYLNPIPDMNGTLKFVTDNSEEQRRGLTISIPLRRSDGENDLMNARYTLSSAQLNALAIAIFLVVNDSQEVGVFDFVAIDDPIQNMDDVNRYTMCDILGEINKQLFFSTHDLEFLKLFIKKNEHKKHDIRVYLLESPHLTKEKIKEVTF